MAGNNKSQYTQETYRQAYGELLRATSEMGIPDEVGKMIARDLHSEQSIRQMTSYLRNVHPTSMEQIADEMVAIKERRNSWIQKKQIEESNNRYNAWLNSPLRQMETDDWEDD